MKNYISFFRSNYFLNIIILLFITFVFINFIHNNSGNYQSGNIKAEVSDQLTSNETYAHILERKCEITGNMHDRHKVRWLKLLALKNIFQISSNINKSLPYYFLFLFYLFHFFAHLIDLFAKVRKHLHFLIPYM